MAFWEDNAHLLNAELPSGQNGPGLAAIGPSPTTNFSTAFRSRPRASGPRMTPPLDPNNPQSIEGAYQTPPNTSTLTVPGLQTGFAETSTPRPNNGGLSTDISALGVPSWMQSGGNVQAPNWGGFDNARINDNSPKYEWARYVQSLHPEGTGVTAEDVRRFVAQDPRWEIDPNSSATDPHIRVKQDQLGSFGPDYANKTTIYQDVLRDAGGVGGISFSNVEGDPRLGYAAPEMGPGLAAFGGGPMMFPSYGGGGSVGSGGPMMNYSSSGGASNRSTLPDPFQSTPITRRADFTPLSQEQFQADPGYQFRMKEALNAIQNSAAGRGALFHPNTYRALEGTASDLASQEYAAANQRAFDAYNANAGLDYQTQAANEANRLSAYGANVNAALGQGNLDLGYTQAGNQYKLGMANVGLGYHQADQSYDLGLRNNALGYYGADTSRMLGLGNLGLGWANYGLNADQQQFNQGYSLANLGLIASGQFGNAAGNYGANAGNYATQAGNANAAGTVGSANAINQGLGNAVNYGLGAYGLYQQRPRP